MQTAYQIDMTAGIEGALADPTMRKDAVSRVALASLPCGLLVVVDATAGLEGKGVKLPTASFTGSADVEGVLMWDPARSPAQGNNYAAGDPLPVLRSGRIFVKPENAVARNAQAFARFAAGAGGTQLGAFRSDADTASAAAVPSARYMQATTGANQITVLEINLPTTAAV